MPPKAKSVGAKDPRDPDLLALRPAGLTDVEVVVFKKLLDAVAERRLAPGMRLLEEELVEIFNVSRERIRRILLVLSQNGIIRLEPHKSAYVAFPDAAERRDIFESRVLIESHIVKALCQLNPARRKKVVAELRGHIEKEQSSMDAADRALQIRLSGDFHLKMAVFAGNNVLLKVLHDILVKSSLSLAAHAHQHDLSCSINEHTPLLDAIERGDVDAAQALLIAHLGTIAEDIAENIDQSSVLQRAFI
ncbi:GntR family transcriptional regulator [Agrobacterium pusense]|jgi:DNA-binding GntR family transcriptional regulator|uniref:GntR family transcriptional regulator n=1 Tax=Agrobacterium pusense TaxID=648995 RepID=UPI0037BFDF2D